MNLLVLFHESHLKLFYFAKFKSSRFKWSRLLEPIIQYYDVEKCDEYLKIKIEHFLSGQVNAYWPFYNIISIDGRVTCLFVKFWANRDN